MTSRVRAGLLLAPLLCAAACSVGDAYCDKRLSCKGEAELIIDEEDTRVCKVEYRVALETVRENKEPECLAAADAQLAYDSCRAALDCRDFVEPDHNGLCATERNDWVEAGGKTQGECGSTD